MNYTEFMNAMLCEIRGQVDAQVRTELYTVTKNNGTRRTGILFKQEDSNLAPTIYLEEFYQKYLKGQQVPDLADSICSIYQEIRVKKTCDCQNLFDFNHVKEHIVYKLIRRDANEELLKQIEDMGVKIAHVTLHVGLGTFRPVKVENVLDHHMHLSLIHI